MKNSALNFLFSLLCLASVTTIKGQSVHRVDPPNWWSDFPLDTVEVFIIGEGFTKAEIHRFKGAERLEWGILSDNVAWVQFRILPILASQEITFKIGRRNIKYPLLERSGYQPQGLSDQDLIYLITPDRFHNGNPKNDDIKGMRERGTDRKEPYARHGGDLEGIGQGLDHIESLGATAVWINPLLENDMARDSYHGYAITDHYQIDPRYGGNKGLAALSKQMQERGLKPVSYTHLTLPTICSV